MRSPTDAGQKINNDNSDDEESGKGAPARLAVCLFSWFLKWVDLVYIRIYLYISFAYLEDKKMKQLLVKLSDEEYKLLESYCKKSGRTKSSVIRYQISNLKADESSGLLKRRIKRISPGRGKLISELIIEMRS
jgi:predicted DNA-binding protein